MSIVIHWFRQDLRLSDNPALSAAACSEVVPVYILTDHDNEKLGAASKWWLHHSLVDLNRRLEGKLIVATGDPSTILRSISAQFNADKITFNRCYEPHNIEYEKQVISALPSESFNGSLLWEPWDNLKDNGTPYRVFTPFYRKGCLGSKISPREPIPAPSLKLAQNDNHTDIEQLDLLPKKNWHQKLEKHWKIGEASANERLKDFISHGLSNYKVGRDFPAEEFVSKLSPHLHFGEISPNQVWHKAVENRDTSEKNLDHFLSELGWREFSYSLLYHFPSLQTQNLQSKFDHFPWEYNQEFLVKWRDGMTGYPIVDAGMRELWETGYMHNRVRMIVGSFLVKNLLIDWRVGERWFWDCLVDADMANNSASWQWVAGSGADAAPYFRIFNPITQGEKFDPDGRYIRKYLPELSHLSNKHIFTPWTANQKLDYPHPIVDLQTSRDKALKAFESIKNQ